MSGARSIDRVAAMDGGYGDTTGSMRGRRGLARRRVIAAAATGLAAAMAPGAGAEVLSSKRGFGDVGANYANLQATGAGWYYTWGTGAANPGTFDAAHYPMFWNAPSQGTIDGVKARNPAYVLGFNEPERADQANMTVAQAVASWTTISNGFAGTGTKLVSPAVADTGGAAGGQQWLAGFMSQAAANNLKVDAVAFHWYGVSTPANPSGAASAFLGRVDSYYNSYKKPVFITEFAIHDWGGAYTDAEITEANRQFLNIVVPALESRGHVAGYSWYHWFSDARLYGGTPPTPTPMAHSYVGALAAGQSDDVGGVNLGQHVAYLTGGELTMTGSAGRVRYVNALANASAISGTVDWGLVESSNWVRVQPGATLRKTGPNTVTLGAGTVTNQGVLEVAEGALRVGVPVAGGGPIHIYSTGGATGSTGRLELTGGVTVAGPVTFAQRNDPGGSDGIRNVGGNNTLSGPITIVVGGNQARVRSDAGQLTLSGGITTTATTPRNLYLQGAGAGLVAGAIADNAGDPAGTINLTKQGTGTWTLSAANDYAGATAVSGGRLRVTGSVAASAGVTVGSGATFEAAATQAVRALTIAAGGAAEVTGAGLKVLTTGALTLSGGTARLDLRRHAVVVDYTGTSPLGAAGAGGLRDRIVASYDHGAWAGPGIGSTDVRASVGGAALMAVGYAEAGELLGGSGGALNLGQGVTAGVDGTAVVIRATLAGDADLNGAVGLNDLVRLANAYGATSGVDWFDGDFDYSGAVGLNDLVLLANNYGGDLAAAAALGGAADFRADSAATVPEPGTVALVAGATAAALGRRGRARRDGRRA